MQSPSTFAHIILAAILTLLAIYLAATLATAQVPTVQNQPAAQPQPAAQAPPADQSNIKVWTSNIVSDERTVADNASLHPIKKIIATRNGSFSGKVVLQSNDTIKNIKASISAISGTAGTIPPADIQIRYATSWNERGWALPSSPDILNETPPEKIEPIDGKTFAPVWITFKLPKTIKPGAYSGKLTVEAAGLNPTEIPIDLEVGKWTLPDPQDYRTWVDFVESPDTLALEYNVPLWSDKHWDLIARSFKYLSDTGSRVVYVPLICCTNLGNEQSMVRWIPKGNDTYDYDFSVMDKYLDTAEKNLGKPKLVVFQVWDICMSKESLKRGLWNKDDATGKARAELLGAGPRVTAIDPKTKELSMITLPGYEQPIARNQWGPLWAQIHKRMVARHLEGTMMLGLMPDLWPTEKEVAMWKSITGGTPWAIHGHAGDPEKVGIGKLGLYHDPKIKNSGSDIGYAAFVYNLVFNCNVEKGRMYGWRNKATLASYLRGGTLNAVTPEDIREYPAFNITGAQSGIGRMGGDFWRPIKNKRGVRSAWVYSRYPENNWRNLDLMDWFLAPGPDGAIATTRLVGLQEGLEECEARISIESALLDPSAKGRLGSDLAKRGKNCLDDLHHAMWKTVWDNDEDLEAVGKTSIDGRNPTEGLWYSLDKLGRLKKAIDKKTGKPEDFWGGGEPKRIADQAAMGQKWFLRDWQTREKTLFDMAAEVAAHAGSM